MYNFITSLKVSIDKEKMRIKKEIGKIEWVFCSISRSNLLCRSLYGNDCKCIFSLENSTSCFEYSLVESFQSMGCLWILFKNICTFIHACISEILWVINEIWILLLQNLMVYVRFTHLCTQYDLIANFLLIDLYQTL